MAAPTYSIVGMENRLTFRVGVVQWAQKGSASLERKIQVPAPPALRLLRLHPLGLQLQVHHRGPANHRLQRVAVPPICGFLHHYVGCGTSSVCTFCIRYKVHKQEERSKSGRIITIL